MPIFPQPLTIWNRVVMKSILKPAALKKGDVIGIVSPASPIPDATKIEQAVRYLERQGYRTVVAPNVNRPHGYLAGTDEERVSDIHALLRDRSVKAIMCVRGGYGSPRLLALLDYRLFVQHPKIVAGFSDVTALQLALWRKCRLITFHGPMLGPDFSGDVNPLTEASFWTAVTSRAPRGPEAFAPAGAALRSGRGTGRLLGGNLSLVVSILGTPYQPDFRRCVLFLEDVEEEPYRVDRMLTQLRNAGILDAASAVLGGQFTDCVPKDASRPSLTVAEVLGDAADRSQVPFLAGLPFGHVPAKITLPVGVRVRVDVQASVIEHLEAAVR